MSAIEYDSHARQRRRDVTGRTSSAASYGTRALSRRRALDWESVTIVDRNPDCAVTKTTELHSDRVSVEVAEWKDYFDRIWATRRKSPIRQRETRSFRLR